GCILGVRNASGEAHAHRQVDRSRRPRPRRVQGLAAAPRACARGIAAGRRHAHAAAWRSRAGRRHTGGRARARCGHAVQSGIRGASTGSAYGSIRRRYAAIGQHALAVVDAPAARGEAGGPLRRSTAMGDHVYNSTELTGPSTKSIDDAVRTAIERATKTVRDIRWFEDLDTRGNVQNGKVEHWQEPV